MAFETTELLISKLNLLSSCKDLQYSNSKTQLTNELREFQKFLKVEQFLNAKTLITDRWQELRRDIYSLEDTIDSVICRSSNKNFPDICFCKRSLNKKLENLRRKVEELNYSNPNYAPVQHEDEHTESTSSDDMQQPPTSPEVGELQPDVHIQPTYSENLQQVPISSQLGTELEAVSEDNTMATVTGPEGSQNLLIPSNPNHAPVQLEDEHTESTYSDDMQQPPISPKFGELQPDVHIQPTDSENLQQVPISSQLGAELEAVSEDNTSATVTGPEDSQNLQKTRRTVSYASQNQPRRSPPRIMSTKGADLEDYDGDDTFQNDSDQIRGESHEYPEEKSSGAGVLVGRVLNKLAQPVLSPSKLHCLILKADVSTSGKAILLWTVYNAEAVKQHFHVRAWVDVSKLSGEQIVNEILKECNYNKKEDGETDQLLQRRFHDFLVWRRYLIVLYGVGEGFSWDNLKSIFPYSLSGSRVILAIPRNEGSKSFANASDEWPQAQKHLVKSSAYLEEDSNFYLAKTVIDELTESILNPLRLSFLISIVGVLGSGKTTPLWAMYKEDILSHFQCGAWLDVPEPFKERDLLTGILKQVTGSKTEKRLPLKSLRQKLRSFLAHKRYLVVLYDVWTLEIWENIKISLPNSLNGSRVILAVREVDVALKTKSWIFGINSGMNLLDVQENASEQKLAKRWEKLADIMDEASGIVVLKDQIKELAELVLNSYKFHFLISVFGEAGSGKTTVVRAFYNSMASKQRFECRAWISVPQDFEEEDILVDLFGQLINMKANRSLSSKQLKDGLGHFLTWKRYLIVLDDVRTPDIWNSLRQVLPINSSNGSRVILTTREAYIEDHMNPQAVVLSLRLLNKDESWILFKKKVKESWVSSSEVDEATAGLDDIPSDLKEEILRRCHGLPLRITMLGGLLSSKNRGQDYEEWFHVMGQTNKRSERKKRVPLSDTKQQHEKKEVIMADQTSSSNVPKENSIEDYPSSSLVQLVPSDAKGNDNMKKVVADNVSSVKYQSSDDPLVANYQHFLSSLDQVIKKDPFTSLDQVPLSDTKQKHEKKKVIMANQTSSSNVPKENSIEDYPSSSLVQSSDDPLVANYQHFSSSTKCCLIYLGLFPKTDKIRIGRLIQLWLAEGLMTQEDLAEDCFKDLVRTNMIEIADRRFDGSPKTCRVTNALYDTLLLNAEKEGFFHIHRSSGSSGTSQPSQSIIRRLAEHSGLYIHTNHSENSIKHLRSYISFYTEKGDAPASGVSEMLKKIVNVGFGMLIVLDLEGVYKPVLSQMLVELRQLKYLNLRRTLLDEVPESVGELPRLETLDIKHTYVMSLPRTIWEAKKLQHLHMSEIYADVSSGKTSARGSLSNLQTLWGLIIRSKVPRKDWLDNLTGLRKLKLTYLEASMPDIDVWLSELTKLQSLKLRSINDSNEPALLKLGDMKKLEKLARLYLLGHLPKPLEVSELPQNLEVLTLSVSHLSVDPMEALGKLEHLKVLRLYAHSFKGEEMTCRGGFPKLQVLKLWMLEELKKWTVDNKSMPILKELEIRCCKKLNEVAGLENLTALNELTLTNMEPAAFIADAEKRISSQVKIIKRVWEFSPPWE